MPSTLIIIAVVAGLVLLWGGGIAAYFLLGRRQSVVEERLGQFTQSGQALAPAAPRAAQPEGPKPSFLGDRLNQMLEGRSFAENIQRDLSRADVKLSAGEYLALHLILFLGATAAMAVFQLITAATLPVAIGIGVATGLGSLLLPGMYVGSQKKGRLQRFDNQLGDMLNLVVNGLRAGYSPMQALESVGKELPPPISAEFKRVVQEMQLGIPMDQALANLTRRIPSKDLDFVVTAMNVQREVGGNLAEILDTISFTIRERVRIKGEIATLTAQGMMTGYVISFLPIGLALFLFLVNRPYMMQMFDVQKGNLICGLIMIGTALLMIGSGFAIVMKIVDIEV
jgi:tight adherence protein B